MASQAEPPVSPLVDLAAEVAEAVVETVTKHDLSPAEEGLLRTVLQRLFRCCARLCSRKDKAQ